MASKQNGNTIPAPRPPFRRQGSSIGAAPHPMTVALAPVSRIDYSVTKGGARTWIVLLVFLFLCSGLYTIFSSRERSENTHSANLDHRDRGIGGHRISELSSNQRQSIKEGEEESDDEVDSMEVSVEAVESDEEDVEESPLEDQLFADLRRRIEDNFQRVKELVKDHENARSVEEDIELEPPLRRIKRKKNRSINRGDKVDKSPLVLAKHTLVDVDNGSDDDDGDDVDNNNSSDDENDNNNSINNDIGDDGDSANDNNIKAEEVGQERGNVYKTQILDEKREHSHRKEIKDSENGIGDETDAFEGLRYRRRRSHFSRHLTDVVSERECKRKHCPPLYQAEPRRSLLKTKHKAASNIVIRAKNKVDDRDHDQSGDYENSEADDEVVVQLNEKNTEVVSLSRYRSSGRETYKRQAITNRDDHKNRNLLDRADSLVEKHNYDAAFTIYNAILRSRPNSPRAHFGKGRAYQLRGEMTSNDIEFIRAIQEYEYVLQNEETPNALFREAALRLIELASFRGDFYRCLLIHGSLVDRFPDEVQHRMNVALTFIKMKRFKDAKKVLHDIIEYDHSNGVALAYYGYIIKVDEDNVEQGVANMKKGLRLSGDQITDAKFYYHLGHGLMFLGRSSEAYAVFEHAASLGLFLSAQQRSMYNIEGLTGRAWWSSEQTGYAKYLKVVERQWVSIRAEAMRVLQSAPSLWKEENPTITVDGRWIAFPLLENGHFNMKHCGMVPQTCSILREFRKSSNASRSEMRFSALSSGAQILPHCGPTNSRLQAHLGLIVPSEARIRVGNEQRGWKTGKFIIFDDSFEHELQFDGASSSSLRLILLIDLWHPEVEWRQRSTPKDD